MGHEMLLRNHWKAINASAGKCRAGLCWSFSPTSRLGWQPGIALSLIKPFVGGMISRNVSFCFPSALHQDKKLLHLSWTPTGCRIHPTALFGAVIPD